MCLTNTNENQAKLDKRLNHTFTEDELAYKRSVQKEQFNYKKTGLIAQIFEEHWEKTYANKKEVIDKYRPNAPKEIQKVIDCANNNLGSSVYICENCDEIYFVHHTCKSRICSSCGYKYKLERVENIMKKSVKCPHRQIVFTIPKELRSLFFIKFETCINILFNAVNLTIQSLANTSYKKKNKKTSKCRKKAYKAKIHATPAFFAFLHSFGRSLIFNPHIHILIAEMKFLENGNVQTWKYFNYSSLSKRYQYILLDLLEKEFGPKFKPMKTKLYKDHPKGFYVYAEPKKFSSFQAGVEYIARYCGRTPISENRIKFYDGENVTFWYDDHATGEHIELTVSAEEFILMLVRHIIPEQTKIIRYYGAYNKKHKALNKVKKLISDVVAKIRYNKLKHREAIKEHFHRDPLQCPRCKGKLSYSFKII